MPDQFYIRAVDAETGETTVRGPVATISAATDLADRWAEEYIGGSGEVWVRRLRGERYQLHAGELYGDGTCSDVLVTIAVDRGSAEP